MSIAFRRIACLLLLVFGVQLWLVVGRGHWGTNLQIKLLVLVAALSAVPWVHRPVARLLDTLRSPTPRARAAASLCVLLLSLLYLAATARQQNRLPYAHVHDERMYLLQARMLASGRLWLPVHPAGDSFETFYVLTQPVYAPMYFPGAALAYAPGLLVRIPEPVIPLMLAAGAAALLFRVMAELVDDVAAALATALLLANGTFRYLSTMYMSHGVMLLLGLALTWAWLNWSKRPRALGWSVGVGFFAGWAAITRPQDALCVAIPIGVAIAIRLVRASADEAGSAKRRIATLALMAAAAAPFIALQLLFNYRVSGSVLITPVESYNRADAPGVQFGFTARAPTTTALRPSSQLPQKQALYDDLVAETVETHQGRSAMAAWAQDRLPWMSTAALPSPLLLILLPLGVFAARGRQWAVVAVLPLFLLAYSGFPWLLAHYCIAVVPATMLLVVLSGRALSHAWPRWDPAFSTALAGLLLLLALTSLPQVNPRIRDAWWFQPEVTKWDQTQLAQHVRTPAIVLYRFNPGNNPYDEPVYNTETVNPDDAPIIRAHDLGAEQNGRLFAYYAARQPQRRVYLVNRSDTMAGLNGPILLRDLGTVAELATSATTTAAPPR